MTKRMDAEKLIGLIFGMMFRSAIVEKKQKCYT